MVILDGPGHSSGRPTVVYGARGIATVDLTVFGPKSGVHSGNYGNWMPNPAMRLASLLASMKDDEGRVTVAGYYDAVAPLTRGGARDARRGARRLRADAADLRRRRAGEGVSEAAGRDADPTLNVRGLASSFVGAGARTIVPDRAIAAIDIRLVKETSGADLVAKLRAHIEKQGYHLVDAAIPTMRRARSTGSSRALAVAVRCIDAFRTSTSDPHARALVASMTRTFGAAAGAAAHARRHGADRAVHRRARLSRRCSCRP